MTYNSTNKSRYAGSSVCTIDLSGISVCNVCSTYVGRINNDEINGPALDEQLFNSQEDQFIKISF